MDKCMFCHDTGLCSSCKGTGKAFGGSGSMACGKCRGSGKCNMCGGKSASSGAPQQPSFGQHQGGFGQQQGGFGQHQGGFGQQHGGFGTQTRQQEDPFEKAKRVVGEGINLLQSQNPVDRMRGIEMINSFDAYHSRKLAYGVALQIYPNETIDDIRAGLISLIYDFGQKDPNAFDHFRHAANDTNPNIVYIGALGLLSYPQGAEEGAQRLRFAYESGPGMLKRLIIGRIGKLGKTAEPLVDLVTKNLGSKSWLMQKATKKAVKNLRKADVNVAGFLIKQLETGNTDDKIAACAGIGSLEKEAKGCVGALAQALKDPSVAVRAKAAWALLQLEKNAAPAEAELTEALKDESPAVSKYALKALNKFTKLSKEQKDEIKDIEEHEKEIKQIQKTWGLKDKELPKEVEEEEVPTKASAETEPDIKNRFFMSHSTKDFAWVQKVARIIESWPNCKAWMCERDIFHGQDWMEAIYDGIENCNWYILFWSPNADASKWTQEEIREAKLRNVQSNDTNPKISIVNLGMSELPRLIQRHQGSKVVSDEDISVFCEKLKTQVEM